MKITICSPATLTLLDDLVEGTPPQGYQFPMISHLVRSLWEDGHNMTLITSTTDVTETTEYQGERLKIIATPRRRRARALFSNCFRSEVRHLTDAIQSVKPDIVHAHWTYEFADAAIKSGLPHLVTAHDYPWAILKHFRDAYRFCRFIYSYRVIPRCQNMTAVSPYIKSALERGYRKKGIIVVPNGTKVSRKKLQPERTVRDQFIITLVGTWDPRKNTQSAILALQSLLDIIPHAELHLFGGGMGPNEAAEAFARKVGIFSGIIYHGYTNQDKIKDFHLKHTDVLLHPSLEESFGMVLVEAMQLGIPVVGGSKSGAVPWVVGSGGLLVDIKHPEKIAEALLRLAKDKVLRERLGKAGAQRALSEFSENAMVEGYLTAYAKVLNVSR